MVINDILLDLNNVVIEETFLDLIIILGTLLLCEYILIRDRVPFSALVVTGVALFIIEITVKFYILNIAFGTQSEIVRYITLMVYSIVVYVIDSEYIVGEPEQIQESQPSIKPKPKIVKKVITKYDGIKNRYIKRPKTPGGDSL